MLRYNYAVQGWHMHITVRRTLSITSKDQTRWRIPYSGRPDSISRSLCSATAQAVPWEKASRTALHERTQDVGKRDGHRVFNMQKGILSLHNSSFHKGPEAALQAPLALRVVGQQEAAKKSASLQAAASLAHLLMCATALALCASGSDPWCS